MNGYNSSFLTVRGLRLHVRSWGAVDAPPLLLVHGFLDASASFAGFAAPLARHFRVVAPDLRGFGLSEWAPQGYWFPDYLADVHALLDALGLADRPLPLLGHSLGAQIVAAYAGAQPQRVSKLVCLDGPTPARTDPASNLRALRMWMEQERDARGPAVDYASFDDFSKRLRKLHPQLKPQQALFLAQCWGVENAEGRVDLRADPRHRRVFPVSYRADDYALMWAQVQAPTLVVDAARSELLAPMGLAARMAQLSHFQDFRRVEIADAGHMLHLEAPEETAAVVLDFLRGH